MKFSMTVKENGDLLIQVTVWAGLNVYTINLFLKSNLTRAIKSDIISTIRNKALVGIDVNTCIVWNTQLTRINGNTF